MNHDSWKAAGYWPRHKRHLLDVSGSVTDWGVGFFDRIKDDQLRTALDLVLQPGGSLFIHGPRGTGKTQFATYLGLAVAVHLGATAVSCDQEYWSWPELLAAERLTFDHPNMASVLGNCRGLDLLVLDEIQEGLATDFQRQSLTRLIDYRYGWLHRTILVANIDAEAIPIAVGTSVYSRLCETGAFLEMNGEPYR